MAEDDGAQGGLAELIRMVRGPQSQRIRDAERKPFRACALGLTGVLLAAGNVVLYIAHGRFVEICIAIIVGGGALNSGIRGWLGYRRLRRGSLP